MDALRMGSQLIGCWRGPFENLVQIIGGQLGSPEHPVRYMAALAEDFLSDLRPRIDATNQRAAGVAAQCAGTLGAEAAPLAGSIRGLAESEELWTRVRASTALIKISCNTADEPQDGSRPNGRRRRSRLSASTWSTNGPGHSSSNSSGLPSVERTGEHAMRSRTADR